MKIIDAHTHIFPSKISEKAVKSISEFYENAHMHHIGSEDALIESGKKINVEKYVVFSTATKIEQVESINNFIIEQTKKHNEFIGLGTMHKDFKNFEAELLKLKENNIKGIKLHPDFQKFEFDNKDLYKIYGILSDLNMFVLTHAGDYRYNYSNPHQIKNIAQNFPKLKIIAAHFGGWSQWDTAVDVLNLENVYFDTSSTFSFTDINVVKKAFKKYDNTHIFFATDFPMGDHIEELRNIEKLNLDDKTFENVLYNNFYNFYNNL